jgi:hypothetical protein
MQPLFNSKGHHIANFVGTQLYAPSGSNIGHFIEDAGIFIDMRGRYLGEIHYDDRLLYSSASPYRSIAYGHYGNYGNIGNYGNPGSRGAIALPAGYRDVAI